ncbi:MAG: right-handed parallel beta-helix repeat-containing protein, partial [Clostridia bacterium]|nr:right-handed parallel beta-helix repeat-containing protein [Clostridia bacterium]
MLPNKGKHGIKKSKYLRRALLFGLLTAVSAAAFPVSCAFTDSSKQYYAELYVSPDGNDMNPGTAEKPLRTLEGARDTVRKIKDGMTDGEIIVYFREGIYRMKEPVVFDVRDSAPEGCRIIYTAFKGEKPVFSGAERVTGWSRYNDCLYAAPLDRDVKLRNLFVNDHRANMGSVQTEALGGYGEYSIKAGQADWAWISGTKFDGVIYNADGIGEIVSGFDDIEIVNGTTWNENIACARDIIYENGQAIVLLQQPYGAIAQTPGWGCEFQCTGQHTLYNAFSFVDSPGEFYYDKTGHMLYYYPLEGEDMSDADVEVPYADRLIVISGNSTEDRVRNLTFSGLTFAHTDYLLTEVEGSHGKATVQAALTTTVFADSNWHSEKYEMCDTFPGVINVTNAESLNFTDNVIKHTGADGLSMTNDVVNCTVSGNLFTDITSSGITIGNPQHVYIGDGDGSNREKFPRGIEGLCRDITVSNNLIYNTGMAHGFGGCAGITAFYVENVKILENHIQQTAFNGISLGWGWSEFLASSTCRNNTVCQNRIIDAVYRLHDTGAIYTIGQMPGTVINENYVKGIPAGAVGAPTYGLHNDDGTAWIEELDNILDID